MTKRLFSRLRTEGGFGIIELSIAMVMLNVGILALVAAFNSGAVSLARASRAANATVIGDTLLERYRGYRNCQIYIDTNANGGIPVTAPYTTDPAYNAAQITQGYLGNGQIPASNGVNCSMGAGAWTCPAASTAAQRAMTAHNTCYLGPDGRTYIVDVFIVESNVANGGNQKKVTVVVRNPANPTGALVRASSTYDYYEAP